MSHKEKDILQQCKEAEKGISEMKKELNSLFTKIDSSDISDNKSAENLINHIRKNYEESMKKRELAFKQKYGKL